MGKQIDYTIEFYTKLLWEKKEQNNIPTDNEITLKEGKKTK